MTVSDPDPDPDRDPAHERVFELEPGEAREAEPAPERSAPERVRAPSVPLARDEPEGPDERTVAERKGNAVETTPDALPPPDDWPAEMFSFPLREPGLSFFAGIGGAFVLVDILGALPVLYFPMRVLLVCIWIAVLRAQAGIIGQSAAGKDKPLGWQSALELDFSGLGRLGAYVVLFFLAFILPSWLALALLFPAGFAIAALLSPYLAVVTLGWSLGDDSLKWPWKALAWLARRPLEFVVGALGWWALWHGQAAIDQTGISLRVVVSPLVRFGSLYVLLVSARAIGVAGRSWTPWGYQSAEQRAD